MARRRRRMRHSEISRIRSWRQLRQCVLPDEPETRRALARNQGVSASCAVASKSYRHHASAGRARADRQHGRHPSRRGHRVRRTRATATASPTRPPKRSSRRAVSDRRSCCSCRVWGRLRSRRTGHHPCPPSRGVGANLHDHLQIRMQYKVKNTSTLNERATACSGKPRWRSIRGVQDGAARRCRLRSLAHSAGAIRASRRRMSNGTC